MGGDRRAKPHLSRDDWTNAAFDMFTSNGIAHLSIETLAKQLGATRGSFYWHFADRADLIGAVMARWRDITFNAMQDLEEVADPRQRLRALLSL